MNLPTGTYVDGPSTGVYRTQPAGIQPAGIQPAGIQPAGQLTNPDGSASPLAIGLISVACLAFAWWVVQVGSAPTAKETAYEKAFIASHGYPPPGLGPVRRNPRRRSRLVRKS